MSLIGDAAHAALRDHAMTPLNHGVHYHQTGMTVALLARPVSVGHARRYVGAALTGMAGVDVDAAELLVSELVTNAIRYGQAGVVHVTVTAASAAVRIEVVNPGCDTGPVLGDPGDADEGGRGLFLVDALATRWGSEVDADRTVVWAELLRGDQ